MINKIKTKGYYNNIKLQLEFELLNRNKTMIDNNN